MRSKRQSGSPEVTTIAFDTLEENLKTVSHMVTLSTREVRLMLSSTRRLDTTVRKHKQPLTRAAAKKIARSGTRLTRSLTDRIERLQVATLWQVVMLATCVEAYLQDVLSLAANVDPRLMRKSRQSAPYATIVAAPSIDELAASLRMSWARRWIERGGPTRWISRLGRMGARGYPSDLASRLELIWGIRHVAVHAAGIATREFVSCHAEYGTLAGQRIRVSTRTFGGFVEAVAAFVEPTDTFFVRRFPSIVMPAK